MVTGPATTRARVRVSWTANPAVKDASTVNSKITQPTLALTNPNTAVVKWAAGTQQTVTWSSTITPGENVRILLSTDGGASFPIVLADSTYNDKSEIITVPNNSTTKARVRIEWVRNAAVADMSNANFAIGAPFVALTKPNGGEKWKKGSTQTIRWTSNLGSKEMVKLELSTNGGVSWLSVASAAAASQIEVAPDALAALINSTPSDGSQNVVLPAITSAKCRVRITWLDNPAVNDISNANFTIIP